MGRQSLSPLGCLFLFLFSIFHSESNRKRKRWIASSGHFDPCYSL
ncbi:putative signal peptide protein [Puccinia sorghi]|uniref:Putative signal peptide protein n=1 Tax=Puccinia sorghi TaxID=27349 RepID=A0A0L6VVG2_9BASI|nr:putative signal peptide protein [Puccinia sorghi]